MSKLSILILLILLLSIKFQALTADYYQIQSNKKRTFYNLNEALGKPDEVYKLVLSNQNIKELPESISKLVNLEVLILSGNIIEFLPQSLSKLKKLKHLDLSDMPSLNPSSVFSSIISLNNLEVLNLEGCKLMYVSYKLGDLYNLKSLNLGSNDISYLPPELKKLKNLENLILSNNSFSKFDEEFVFWKKLKSIDLSFNTSIDYSNVLPILGKLSQLKTVKIKGMKYFPEEIGFLRQVKVMDLSKSNFQKIPAKLRNLDSLEHLTLRYCKPMNYNILFRNLSILNNLRIMEVWDDSITNIPPGLLSINTLRKLTIRGKYLEYFSEDISQHTNLRSLSIIFSPKLNTNLLLTTIGKIKNLQKLEIKYCQILSLPSSISTLSNINHLNLTGNYLIKIPIELTRLNQLKYLDLTNNPLDKSKIIELRKAMPACKIVFGLTNTKESSISIKDKSPMSNVTIRYNTFGIDANKSNELDHFTGSRLLIPPNAFLDKTGKVVSGKVDIKYRELKDPLSILFGGILMKYDSGGTRYDFASAGMIDFSASKNGEPLKPNPNAKIRIDMISHNPDPGLNLYYYDQKKKNWVFKGKGEILESPSNVQPNITTNPNITKLPPRPEPPYKLLYEKIFINFSKNPSTRNFEFSVIGSFKNNSADKSTLFNTKYYPELEYLSTVNWIYDGENNKEEFRTLKQINKKLKHPKYKGYIYDLQLTPNLNADNYIIRFIFEQDTKVIPVYSNMGAVNPQIIQKRNKKFYEKYKEKLDQRLVLWKEIDKAYDAAFNKYKSEMEQYRKDKFSFQDNIEQGKQFKNQTKEITKTVYRSFELDHFGTWNCGNIIKKTYPRKILITFIDKNLKLLESQGIYLIDESRGGFIQFIKSQEITYDAKSRNSLLVILDNNSIGLVTNKEFRNITNESGKNKIIQLEIISTQSLSIEKLKNLIGIN